MNGKRKTTFWICIFSVAMAALEAAVVIYLRSLYYPGEFSVSFKLIDPNILLVEIIREVATLVMLFSIGWMCGRNSRERFAYFLLSFAVWDIFYYAWLKVLIAWPVTFLDWDILFLIPLTWIGPVAAPLICSLTMILIAFLILKFDFLVPRSAWALFTAGALLILYTFMRDYAELIMSNGFLADYPALIDNPAFVKMAANLVPKPYLWTLFWLGELLILSGIASLFKFNGGSRAGVLSRT